MTPISLDYSVQSSPHDTLLPEFYKTQSDKTPIDKPRIFEVGEPFEAEVKKMLEENFDRPIIVRGGVDSIVGLQTPFNETDTFREMFMHAKISPTSTRTTVEVRMGKPEVCNFLQH